MAKQFGVSDEAIAGLEDPARHPFPAGQAAALRFADAMTRGDGRVPDRLFEALRRHFSEPQVVEIAAVIGLFNYFNRFNNALHMEITLADPDVLVRRVEQATATPPADPVSVCDRVAGILVQGRRYSMVAIYARVKERLVLRAHRGPGPPGRTPRLGPGTAASPGAAGAPGGAGRTRAARSRLAVPLREGSIVVGVIEVRNGPPPALEEEDLRLLERVGMILAPVVASSR